MTLPTSAGHLYTSVSGLWSKSAWWVYAVYDHKPETDVYWCTADIGWVTGHSYICLLYTSDAADD